MLKKVFSTTSAMGIMLVMTSSWVGQAQAFTYTGEATSGGLTTQIINLACSNATYGTGTAYDAWSGCNTADTRFQASTSVTSATTLRTATAHVSNLISGRMSAFNADMSHKTAAANTNILGKGISAGGSSSADTYAHGADIWFNTAWSHVNNRVSSTASTGDIVNAMLGLDYDAADDIRAGLGLGYESSGYSTSANKGGVRGTGGMIVPYLAFDLDPAWKLDVHAGYSKHQYHLRRLDSGITASAPLKISGDTHSNRYFGALNLTTMHQSKAWSFNGRTGLMYAVENINAFTDDSAYLTPARKTKLARLDAVLNAAYDLNKWVEPYVGVNPIWDFNQSDITVYQALKIDGEGVSHGAAQENAPNGRFAVVYSAGLHFDVMKKFDAVLSASTEQHRRHQQRNALSLSANAEF